MYTLSRNAAGMELDKRSALEISGSSVSDFFIGSSGWRVHVPSAAVA